MNTTLPIITTSPFIMIFKNKIKFMALLMMVGCTALQAQPYAPPVGQAGTSAIYKDSLAFVNWANNSHIVRGYQDISNPSLGYASVGDSSMATGKAQSNSVVSLGDGGWAVCTFQNPISNGNGFDFAVFENGFDDTFLELAFVEVSSDGINFVRFPAHSLTDTVNQTTSFGPTDATKINNLAGKYRGGYGTPFDLQELAGKPNLDISAITHVKIIDVVGSLTKPYATYDSYGNKVNDPWPTAFPSGGFDLDAVGVIHEKISTGIPGNKVSPAMLVYPNPVSGHASVYVNSDLKISSMTLVDLSGNTLITTDQNKIALPEICPGIYFLKIVTEKGIDVKKLVVRD